MLSLFIKEVGSEGRESQRHKNIDCDEEIHREEDTGEERGTERAKTDDMERG